MGAKTFKMQVVSQTNRTNCTTSYVQVTAGHFQSYCVTFFVVATILERREYIRSSYIYIRNDHLITGVNNKPCMMMIIYKKSSLACLSASIIALGMVHSTGADHCSQPGASVAIPILAPHNGQTILVPSPGPLSTDATAVFSFEAKAGCTYKLSFCPADGGATGAVDETCDSDVRGDAPWAAVYDSSDSELSGCTSDTCVDSSGAVVGAITNWAATTDRNSHDITYDST